MPLCIVIDHPWEGGTMSDGSKVDLLYQSELIRRSRPRSPASVSHLRSGRDLPTLPTVTDHGLEP